jgi:hypothetical protein
LSLARLARASRSSLGNQRERIPRGLYRALGKSEFSPSLYQIFTLSVLTGYRLADWLAVFGFSLDDISRFQVLLPAVRTVELDSHVYTPGRSLSWFPETRAPDFCAPLMPFASWLELPARKSGSIPYGADPAYRFVKIGSEDAFAFPDLLPGSIVRIAPERAARSNPPADRLLLVEHSHGLTCTRLSRSTSGRFVLCSRQLPYAPVELREGTEAQLLGAADFEIRRLGQLEKPVVPKRLGRYWTPAPLLKGTSRHHVGECIERARTRSGLSFREASERTRLIARALGEERYYCAPGTLSDFETRKQLPRQVHKIISLCAVYFLSAAHLLEAAGIGFEDAGNVPMPRELLRHRSEEIPGGNMPSAFFAAIGERFGQVPYFLAPSLQNLFALPDFSVRDVFWAGGLKATEDSGLSGALFLVVDRKQKTPRPSLTSPAWQQPVYVLLARNGTYLCGFCTLENGVLMLRPCVAELPKVMRLGNRMEAEVVGRVIGMVRRVPDS